MLPLFLKHGSFYGLIKGLEKCDSRTGSSRTLMCIADRSHGGSLYCAASLQQRMYLKRFCVTLNHCGVDVHLFLQFSFCVFFMHCARCLRLINIVGCILYWIQCWKINRLVHSLMLIPFFTYASCYTVLFDYESSCILIFVHTWINIKQLNYIFFPSTHR